MKFLFVIHDYYPPNHLLQPRAYLHRIGLAAAAQGHSVTFLTNSSAAARIDQLAVISADSLSSRNASQILAAVRAYDPDVIVWSTSHAHVLRHSAMIARLPAPVLGFLACPVYTLPQLVRLIPRRGIRGLGYYALNRLAQKFFERRLLTRRLFAGFLSQSRSNLPPLDTVPAHCLIHLPPGLDHELWFPEPDRKQRRPSAQRRILFFGPVRKNRGLQVLLQAYERCVEDHPGTELAVHLRGATAKEIGKVQSWLSDRDLARHATVVGGWTPQQELREAIWDSDMVVIPFLLSETDSPISILEAKACGRPVISSSVAGIPELIGRGGAVLSSCSATEVAREISSLIADPPRLRRLTEFALAESRDHASWDSTCGALLSSVEKILET